MKSCSYFLVGFLSGLSLFAGVALAEEGAGMYTPGADREQRCAENPQKCQEMKSRMQEKCAQDPKRCEEIKSRMAERKAKCDANPEACKKHRDKIRARRKECRENPDKCQRRSHDKAPMGQSTE